MCCCAQLYLLYIRCYCLCRLSLLHDSLLVRFECGNIQKPLSYFITRYSKHVLLASILEVEVLVLVPVLGINLWSSSSGVMLWCVWWWLVSIVLPFLVCFL